MVDHVPSPAQRVAGQLSRLDACACCRHLRLQPGTAVPTPLCPGAQDEAAAVAREASQLAEKAADLAAAQVCMTHETGILSKAALSYG